jgi:hypothetical protein
LPSLTAAVLVSREGGSVNWLGLVGARGQVQAQRELKYRLPTVSALQFNWCRAAKSAYQIPLSPLSYHKSHPSCATTVAAFRSRLTAHWASDLHRRSPTARRSSPHVAVGTLPHPHQVPLPTRHCPTLVASDTSSSPLLVPLKVHLTHASTMFLSIL